jgi:hypothetical protein
MIVQPIGEKINKCPMSPCWFYNTLYILHPIWDFGHAKLFRSIKKNIMEKSLPLTPTDTPPKSAAHTGFSDIGF